MGKRGPIRIEYCRTGTVLGENRKSEPCFELPTKNPRTHFLRGKTHMTVRLFDFGRSTGIGGTYLRFTNFGVLQHTPVRVQPVQHGPRHLLGPRVHPSAPAQCTVARLPAEISPLDDREWKKTYVYLLVGNMTPGSLFQRDQVRAPRSEAFNILYVPSFIIKLCRNKHHMLSAFAYIDWAHTVPATRLVANSPRIPEFYSRLFRLVSFLYYSLLIVHLNFTLVSKNFAQRNFFQQTGLTRGKIMIDTPKIFSSNT